MKHEDQEQQQYLLMITDLLAAAAFGENAGVESLCHTIFTVNELIDIICNKEIPMHRKRPFMKFLLSVYMEEKGVEMLKER